MKTNFRLISIMALLSLLAAACNQENIKQSPTRMGGQEEQIQTQVNQEVSRVHRTEKRYALVIGNANYVGDPNIKKLKNPVNDAKDMAQTLRELGFDQVTLKTNLPNGEAMENAVHQFSLKLVGGGVGLFYYAGHGIQGADGENYLIPTQVSIPTQVELKRRAMPAKYVLDKMEYARNELNIIILDACRNNPLPARGREVVKSGLAEMPSPAGSIIIFATAPGAPAYDGSGRNGVFTKYFLKGMKKYAHMDIEQMLKRVRNAVERETKQESVAQVPWQNSSLKRDFCFSPSGCFDPELEEARRQAKIQKERAEKARREAERAKAELEATKRPEDNAIRLADEAEKTRKELEKARRQAKIQKERADKARIEAERAKAEATKPSNVVDTAAVAKAKQQLEEKMKQLDQQMKALDQQMRQLKEKTKLAEEAEKRAKKAQREAEAKRKLAERQAREAKRQREKAEAEKRLNQETTIEQQPKNAPLFTPMNPG